MSLADGESEDDEGGHGGELRPSRDILQSCAPAQSDNVDVGEDGDEHEADRVCAGERHACQRENHMLFGNGRDDVSHVGGGCDGESGDGATIGDGEQHPAVKKRNQVAVSFAEVNVLSAGVGEHGAEFGEGDAGAQRNHSAEDPHQKKQRWIRQRPGNVFGGKKNRRADDAAHEKQYGVKQAKPTDETRLLAGCLGFRRQGSGSRAHSVAGQFIICRSSRWSFAVRRWLFVIPRGNLPGGRPRMAISDQRTTDRQTTND